MDELVTRALLATLATPTPDPSPVLRGRGRGWGVGLADLPTETWRAVLQAAQQHRITPLVAHRLNHKRIELPEDVDRELKRALRENARRNTVLYHELAQLLEQFRAENIPVLALKGIHLAALVYGDSRLRTMGDVDLLLPRSELEHAERILVRAGATPFNQNRIVARDNYHFVYTFPESLLVVEIHWSLYPAPTPFQVDEAGLWQRARQVNLAGQSVCVLCPEDLVLHLCVHAAKETWQWNLRMVCDLDAVTRKYVDEIDWDGVAERARELNAVKPTYLFLRLTRELLHSPVPSQTLDALEPPHFDMAYYALARTQVLAGETERDGKLLESPYLARVMSRTPLSEKLDVIRTRLLPPRENLAQTYPARADSWKILFYYPVRAKDVALKYVPYLWGMAFGNPQARAVTERTNTAARLGEWLMKP